MLCGVESIVQECQQLKLWSKNQKDVLTYCNKSIQKEMVVNRAIIPF